ITVDNTHKKTLPNEPKIDTLLPADSVPETVTSDDPTAKPTVILPEEPTSAASFTQDNQTAPAPQNNGLNFAAILKNLQPSAETRANIQNVADFMGLPVNMADKTDCESDAPKVPPPTVGAVEDANNKRGWRRPLLTALRKPQPTIVEPDIAFPQKGVTGQKAPPVIVQLANKEGGRAPLPASLKRPPPVVQPDTSKPPKSGAGQKTTPVIVRLANKQGGRVPLTAALKRPPTVVQPDTSKPPKGGAGQTSDSKKNQVKPIKLEVNNQERRVGESQTWPTNNPTITPKTPDTAPAQASGQSSARLDESPDKGLGYIVAKYEGKVGSVVKGEDGRWSYGIYQFDSKSGIYHFLNSSPKYAAQLYQGGEVESPGFNKKWEDIGNSDPIGFEAAQRAAGKKYYFDPVVAAGGKLGFDTSSRAVQEALYSGSIQHGHWIGEVLPDIAKHNKIKNLTVEQQIHALYEGRRRYADTLKKSLQDIVKKRTFKEEPEVMKLVQWELRHPKVVDKPPTSKDDIPPSTSASGEPSATAQKSPRVIKIVPLEKLRIKSAESTAGGEALEGTMDFARVVQGELGDEMIRFNGFNDEYHQKKEPGSNHTQGLSFDIKIRNPKDSAKIQAKIKQLAAFFGLNIVVDDEYKKLSTNGNYPHIHVNFHNKQDAALFSKRFKQYQTETAKPISALTQPLANVDDTSFTGLPASPDSASASAAAPSSAAVASGIAATVTQDALATYAAPTAPTVPFSPPLPPSAAPITVPPPSIAQAPDITMPLANNTPQKPSAPPPIITADAGQDVPDRQIAHIVNGGIGALL
ncbi:MAG: hypothetical protein PHU14_11230, partial [Methylovulum sp.]|nr:hypothetical protein [Methylovulum sp.]